MADGMIVYFLLDKQRLTNKKVPGLLCWIEKILITFQSFPNLIRSLIERTLKWTLFSLFLESITSNERKQVSLLPIISFSIISSISPICQSHTLRLTSPHTLS